MKLPFAGQTLIVLAIALSCVSSVKAQSHPDFPEPKFDRQLRLMNEKSDACNASIHERSDMPPRPFCQDFLDYSYGFMRDNPYRDPAWFMQHQLTTGEINAENGQFAMAVGKKMLAVKLRIMERMKAHMDQDWVEVGTPRRR